MNAVAFDALEVVRTLREKANLSPAQADAMSEAFVGIIPTKASDITNIRSNIGGLRLLTKADIEATKSDLIEGMFGTIGFQTVGVLGAVVALARSLH